MAFPDYAYDLYEDFEDALGAGWTEVDNDNNLDPNDAAAKYYDSTGMSIDDTGDTAGHEAAYVYYDFGSQITSYSLGFWYYQPTTTDEWWGGNEILLCGRDTDQFPYIIRLHAKCADGTYTLYLRNDGNSSAAVTISPATWYWITIKAVQNDTCYLRVYDTAQTIVGAEQSLTGENYGSQYLQLGNIDSPGWSDNNLDRYFDDLVIDWTDSTYPLLGWETAAGAMSIPLATANLNARRRILGSGSNTGLPIL